MNYVVAFYERFREQIAGIKTIEQRNSVLADMSEYFTESVRSAPESRNTLSEAYQTLKAMCWEGVY